MEFINCMSFNYIMKLEKVNQILQFVIFQEVQIMIFLCRQIFWLQQFNRSIKILIFIYTNMEGNKISQKWNCFGTGIKYGFITMGAYLASRCTNFCLVPEFQYNLTIKVNAYDVKLCRYNWLKCCAWFNGWIYWIFNTAQIEQQVVTVIVKSYLLLLVNLDLDTKIQQFNDIIPNILDYFIQNLFEGLQII
ncbi:hypothetical protein IMG5_153750 [Ichthyophthirius multifiliis]|uniref:Transmembrane protein n=1 Tax=Ichthyophthirius multifiliis TaxID=5932 RepID=G0QZ14_ICHMU|nr:hypothetical protein IMG5_153750 [Ichthyophthirius multifiliis]EGR29540.1 hypothetical protein IMG5_153750 [Ichthyophthirius multifiliis]|eukprot:XP_004030776.1 hypothetical protein IMG5_153750 [Ichthyophthirius multifiliis]